MALTYAEARAACVARWGSATFSVEPGRDEHDAWPAETDWCFPPTRRSLAQAAVSVDGPRVTLSVWRHMSDEPMQEWLLAGDGDVTPLPAALDAADAFLRTHTTTATKGP